MGPPPPVASSNKKKRHISATTSSSSNKQTKWISGGTATSKQLHSKSSGSAPATATKRRNDATQTSLSFAPQEKYKIGLKLLLSDSIYGAPEKVSCRKVLFVFLLGRSFLFHFLTEHSFFLPLLMAGSSKGQGLLI